MSRGGAGGGAGGGGGVGTGIEVRIPTCLRSSCLLPKDEGIFIPTLLVNKLRLKELN